MYILITILLIALDLFLWVFFLSFIFSAFCDLMTIFSIVGFPGGSDSKVSVYNEGDLGSIPGLRRPPGEGNGNPLQYSCLENPMDGGTWCGLLSIRSGTTEPLHFTSFSWQHFQWPLYL